MYKHQGRAKLEYLGQASNAHDYPHCCSYFTASLRAAVLIVRPSLVAQTHTTLVEAFFDGMLAGLSHGMLFFSDDRTYAACHNLHNIL